MFTGTLISDPGVNAGITSRTRVPARAFRFNGVEFLQPRDGGLRESARERDLEVGDSRSPTAPGGSTARAAPTREGLTANR